MGRDSLIKMNDFEYEFLTGNWEGPKGAAYNAVYEFCTEFRWMDGFNMDGNPSITEKGMKAIEEYKNSS